MKFIDFFAGVGGFRRGLELSGHQCIGFCEWDKFATASYTSMHLITEEQRKKLSEFTIKNRQKEILKDEYRNGEWYSNDIRTVDAGSLPDADCWCFGAPCFLKGTMITTHRGTIPIEEIQSGDYVLTHKNRFQKVVKPMISVKKGIYTLKVKGSPITEVTGNHRFYVRDKKKIWNNSLKKYEIHISDPYWKEVQKFDGNELVQFTINKNSENIYDLTEEECWLIGRYVADGYIRDDERKDRPSRNQKIIFCIGKGKENEFENYSSLFSMSKTNENNVTKYITGNKKLFALCSKCGKGAENKNIPQFILNLDSEMLKFFISGYMSGDGSFSSGLWKATSVSKKLIYQLGQCISKAYRIGYSIYFDKRPEKCMIEGRTVNQKDTWSITFRLNAEKTQSYYFAGSLWQPVRSIEYNSKRKEIVYNMEVENDNSYTANNMGVHNCQDFSIAGKRAGLDGDRSSLIREIFRLLEEQKEQDRPEWLIYENVKGMLSSNRGLDYLSILSEMDRLGYDIEWQNINSKWWVPQNRERIYTVGHLRRCGRAKIFPVTGADGENSLLQMIPGKQGQRVYDAYGISSTISSQGGGLGAKTGLYAIEVIGNTSPSGKGINGNVYDSNGLNPKLTTNKGEGNKIAIPIIDVAHLDKNQNGRRFKENGEPMFTLTAQDRHGVAIEPIIMSGNNIIESDDICRCLNANDQRKVFGAHQERTIAGVKINIRKKENGIYVEMPGGFLSYCVWYEKYNCYIAIRRLTPKECFRLQGWTDDYFQKAAFVNSDSQLYKQAGNGVTVDVVKAIGEKIAEFEKSR